MFFEEGYIPLGEVTSEVFRRLQTLKADGKIVDLSMGLQTHLTVTVWDICDASSKIGVTAATGGFIEASKELTAWVDPRGFSNAHLDLRVGTVGSSTMPDPDGTRPSREDLQFRYGGFLSLPVCVPTNSFQSSLTYLDEQVTQKLRDEEVVNAAKTILGMVRAKVTVTRDIARAKLGAGLSRRKLKLAWALAAEHHPPLSEANRWEGL